MQDLIKPVRGKRLTQDLIIEQFKNAHGDYYDYSKVLFKTVWDDVIIICPRHGEYLQQVKRHKNGARCRKCYLEDVNGNFMKKPEYREKARKTMTDNQLKLKAGMLAKYGVDNPSKLEEIRINKRDFFMSKYGVENPFQIDVNSRIEKSKNTMIENGRWIKDEDKKPFELYKKKVWIFTNKSIVDFDAYWLLKNRSINDHHIDHIYSIYDGFVNKVEPKLIGSIVNLQSLDANHNRSKGSDSWITLEDLTSVYSQMIN
jgi:hypothetical protein